MAPTHQTKRFVSPLTFSLWLALVLLAGWTAFPLASRTLNVNRADDLFSGGLPDGGLAVGRILFLALWTMLSFWLGQFGVSVAVCAWIYLPLALVGIFVGWRDRQTIKQLWRERRKTIIASEILFVLVFLIFFALRGFWSDTNGTNGEKSMDSALIGSISRARQLPPPNPYAAGARINSYYYFGPLQTALLTRAAQTEVRWSYNLMCATLPALCFPALFALGGALTGSNRGGAWVAGAVLGGGTLQPLQQWAALDANAAAQFLGLNPFAISRVIPFTINEFPWFTFNQADLHGHYFDFPFEIALMTLGWSLIRAKRPPLVAVAALVAGAAILTNTWDFPAFSLLIILSILVASGQSSEAKSAISADASEPRENEKIANEKLAANLSGERHFSDLPARIALAIGFGAGALLLASPFLRHLQSAATPPQPLAQPASPLREWLLLWGPMLLGWGIFSALQTFARSRVWRATLALMGAGLLVAAAYNAWQTPSILVLPIIAASAGLAIYGALTNRGVARYLCLLTLCAMVALVWSETTWAGFLGNPEKPLIKDSIRQDTVFKFGLQVWMLWGTASAAGVWIVAARGSRQLQLMLRAVAVPLALIMLAGNLSFTLLRVRFAEMIDAQRSGDAHWLRFDGWDAWAHLAPPEKAAAAWLMHQARPGEHIIEAAQGTGGDYSEFTRYANATGLATVIGPQAHSYQWNPASAPGGRGKKAREAKASAEWGEVFRRQADLRLVYSPVNNLDRVQILKSYGVKYLMWGELERREYGDQTFADVAALPVAAQFGAPDDLHRVTIFRVD